jgi:succinate dehydrogenase/fumarate reductase-like Fe-S protein
MIPDYDDDKKMAEAGRKSVKWKAINNSKEAIRDVAVHLGGNLNNVQIIKDLKVDMNQAIDNLIEALELQ